MKTTRINKWKNYRESILDNDNLNQSIINGDKKLSNMLEYVNFDLNSILDEKIDNKVNKKSDYFKEQEDMKKIDNIIDEILKNEIMKNNDSSNNWDINSHTYDQYIDDNFSDFKTADEDIQTKTSTTDLKVKKVSI